MCLYVKQHEFEAGESHELLCEKNLELECFWPGIKAWPQSNLLLLWERCNFKTIYSSYKNFLYFYLSNFRNSNEILIHDSSLKTILQSNTELGERKNSYFINLKECFFSAFLSNKNVMFFYDRRSCQDLLGWDMSIMLSKISQMEKDKNIISFIFGI